MGAVVVPYSALAVLLQVAVAQTGSLVFVAGDGRPLMKPLTLRAQLLAELLAGFILLGALVYLLLSILSKGTYYDVVLLTLILASLAPLVLSSLWFALHYATEPTPAP